MLSMATISDFVKGLINLLAYLQAAEAVGLPFYEVLSLLCGF